ncbi:hypothetical protein ZPR_0564 [Zunongwangia profunda SM-A87]|uniref:Uncharacterized protein n=1 Tax=Zunongwangia profunda (strain DSM 18752 / CCTCC AB 206139 / SM-A87) TaxID=655815 RepID=D5BFH7_ZUNPS|nr:hypothetical protein ZPR_0564 [Zunongwangia profunda SM-A87]
MDKNLTQMQLTTTIDYKIRWPAMTNTYLPLEKRALHLL